MPLSNQIITREQLNRKLWGAADILRGAVDAADFKNHILALLFLKRLSDVFDERRAEIIVEWKGNGKSQAEAETIADDPDEYGGGSYYIPEGARWGDLMAVGENRAEAVDKALARIEEDNNRYLEGVLGGVHFNDERRFGDPQTMDSMMQRLLTHFGNIPLGNRNLAEPDVLGNAYEYLIERFAEDAGKKGGEFYTPRTVVRTVVELLSPREGMRIHDPTCGSGGMLIECGDHVADHGGNPRNVTLTGQEKNYGTWSICKLNMLLHNFPDADIRAGDTIRSPKFETGGVLQTFDRVIANPPFSLKDWGHDKAEGDAWRRFTRGIPPRTKGDMAFLQHMIAVASQSDGMVGVIMPHGVLFRGGAEKKIRQALLDEDLFEAVIGLPAHLFFGTGIPAAILVLNRNKHEARRGKVLFIDASQEGFYLEGKARNYLRDADVLRIAALFHGNLEKEACSTAAESLAQCWLDSQRRHLDRQITNLQKVEGNDDAIAEIRAESEKKQKAVRDGLESFKEWLEQGHPAADGGTRGSLEKYAALVPLETIAGENDFNLNITRYVDAMDPPPQLDVVEELKTLRELEAQRTAAEHRMDQLLDELGYGK